jgi:hypothetical protein
MPDVAPAVRRGKFPSFRRVVVPVVHGADSPAALGLARSLAPDVVLLGMVRVGPDEVLSAGAARARQVRRSVSSSPIRWTRFEHAPGCVFAVAMVGLATGPGRRKAGPAGGGVAGAASRWGWRLRDPGDSSCATAIVRAAPSPRPGSWCRYGAAPMLSWRCASPFDCDLRS